MISQDDIVHPIYCQMGGKLENFGTHGRKFRYDNFTEIHWFQELTFPAVLVFYSFPSMVVDGNCLPLDVLGIIFQLLPETDWKSVLCVSKSWNKIGRKIFDPSRHGNRYLVRSCARGCLEAVRYLLKDPRVDPAGPPQTFPCIPHTDSYCEDVPILAALR